MSLFRWVLALGLLCIVPAARAAPFTVSTSEIADQKAVFATVESAHVVPARTRIGGTIISFAVRRGEAVQAAAAVRSCLLHPAHRAGHPRHLCGAAR